MKIHEFVALSMLLSVSACRAIPPRLEIAPREVERQDQAASTHVSVISVARWEEFSDALQPKFNLKPEEALAQAIPSTMRIEEKLLDAFAARLKLSPPISSDGSSLASNSATRQIAAVTNDSPPATTSSSETSTTSSETETRAAGNTSALTFTPPATPDLTSIGAPGGLQGPIGIDPIARYTAATALYQEVQLLNRYVKEATIRRNAQPVVVRLQVSVLPVLRGQAYDASTTISFFTGRRVAGSTGQAPASALVAPGSIATVTGQPPPTDEIQRLVQKFDDEPCSPPTVVPLLVTDNLESASHTRALAQVREYALAVGVLSGGFAANADVERIQRGLSGLVGQDLNSLLTVGRVSDNTLRVRLGAMLQGESRYAMVPRTHNITLLVFVPMNETTRLECRHVSMISRTEITDAVRGRVLPSRTRAQVAQMVREIASRYGIEADTASLDELRLFAQQNDYSKFEALLTKLTNPEGSTLAEKRQKLRYPEAIWLELTSILVGSQYSPSLFELPAARAVAFEPNIGALITDDTKTQAVATVPRGTDLLASELAAVLYVKEASGAEFPIPSTRVEVSDNRQVAHFYFRSLAPLMTDPHQNTLRLDVIRTAPPWENIGQPQIWSPRVRYIQLKPLAAADPAYGVTTGARVIRSEKGIGTVQITFRRKAEFTGKVLLTVIGADLSGATQVLPANALQQAGADWVVHSDGTAQLQLRNLSQDTEVSIAVGDDKGVGPLPVRVRVMDIAAASPQR